jgi:hypothetical protein
MLMPEILDSLADKLSDSEHLLCAGGRLIPGQSGLPLFAWLLPEAEVTSAWLS